MQGGEVVQETITPNVEDDAITLEFQRTDGTLITQLLDFRNVSTLESSLLASYSINKSIFYNIIFLVVIIIYSIFF